MPSRVAASSEPIYLIVRSDDGGMSHSVNRALQRVIASGLPVSAVDANPYFFNRGLPDMSRNRRGELDALTSERFRDTSAPATSSSSRIGS